MRSVSAARGNPRGIPTSRAYWDLQAEKLLNRVFEPAETIDLEPESRSAGAPGPAAAQTAEAPPSAPSPAAEPGAGISSSRQRRARRPAAGASAPQAGGSTPAPRSGHAARAWPTLPTPLLLVAVFAGAGLITATSGVLAVSQWNRFQESLQQERNLLLVERLRSFGPAVQPAAPTPPAPTLAPPALESAGRGGPVDDGNLPPPPPSEPWIEELATLPQRSAPLLRVPLNPGLGRAAATPPAPRRTPAGPVPLLVGVVAVPGKPGSAIFQLGGSTSTVAVGETIGSSGWRLIASDLDSVQIEHQGEVRRISIGGGG